MSTTHADDARDQISDAINQLMLPDLPEGTKVYWQEPREESPTTTSALVVVEDPEGSGPYFITVQHDHVVGVSCRSSQGDAWETGWEA